MKHKNLGLVPLKNFGVVEEDKIYRCAQPLYDHEYEWLVKHLGIKTIVNLRAESEHDKKYCEQYHLSYVHICVEDHKEPTMGQCKQLMHIIRDIPSQPILIHCEHGHGRTSTFCVLARLAMGWDLDAAMREEEEKFHYAFKHAVQKEFLIKNFSNDGESTV